MGSSYTRQLTTSMAVPTAMVAGAGFSVVAGAWWLAGIAPGIGAAQLTEHLRVAGQAVLLLTLLCVGVCLAFMVWIRRNAQRALGADPALARDAMLAMAGGQLHLGAQSAPHGSVMASLHDLAAALAQAMGSIREAAGVVQTASQEIASGNADLSARTETTSSRLQETASAMAQITLRVGQSVESTTQADAEARRAADVARHGSELVAQVVATMEEIQASSRRIGAIIGTVDGIAFQTNILALNAAVEAARAGEQGRGFAVVASEVRSLAQRSAEAAREIKTLIGASVERVDTGSRLVSDAGAKMAEIVTSVQRVSNIIGEISTAATEQRAGIGEVNGAVGELDRMAQQNAAMVEQSAAAAESLKDQAQRLGGVVAAFRIEG